MSHFQLSQDSDESFSNLSRLGWVIFKSSRLGCGLTSRFWFSEFGRIQETWGKDLTKNVKSSHDLDEFVLLFNCHLRKLGVVHSNRSRWAQKIHFKSLKTWMKPGIPISETCSSLWGPPASLLVTLVARSMFLCWQNRHLLSKRSPDGPCW